MAKAPEKLGPIRTCPKFKALGGLAGIESKLKEQLGELDWPQSDRTLAMQLGRLDRGDTVWWRKRPKNAAALAELLELDLFDLGLVADSPAHHFMEFTGFLGMPPLDLRKGHPWHWSVEKQVANQETEPGLPLEEWLRPTPYQFRAPHGLHWLSVDDDLERQVLARSLAMAGHFPVRFVQTLSDAADALTAVKPVAIVVDRLDGDADFNALAIREEGAGLLVIAPAMLPVRAESSGHDFLSWERMSLRSNGGAQFDLSGSSVGSIRRFEWARQPDWRWRFLQWLEKHRSQAGVDSLYSAKGIKAWLDGFDPREEWFDSVADVLSVCLGFESEKKLPKAHEQKAGSKLLKALQRGQRQFPVDLLQELSMARWSCGALAWRGALSMPEWAELGARYAGAPDKADLDAVVHGKTLAERQRAAKTLEMRQPQAWARAGILKTAGDGFDFQQQSMVNLLVRDAVMEAMTQFRWADWAWACFDAQRRALVDAALDALAERELQAMAIRVTELDNQSAYFVGASEALFCAVGRRIAQGYEISALGVFGPLVRSVVQRLDLANSAWLLPIPWTRPVETQEQQLDWIAVCWAWSLLPAPQELAPACWLFPGWGDVAAIEAPGWLDLWPEKRTTQLPVSWQRFFCVADEWFKDLDQPLVNAPRVLLIAHLGRASAGGWPADVAWWLGLWPHGDDLQCWIDEALIDRFKPGKAERVWPSYADWERQAQHHWGLQCLRPVRRWFMETLPAAQALEQLTEADRLYFASCPQTLPPQWRGLLLRSLKTHWESISGGQAMSFLVRFGSAIADELEDVMRDSEVLGVVAGELMWKWNAIKARELLMQPLKLRHHVWLQLLYSCPANELRFGWDAMRRNQSVASSDCLNWIQKNLPDSALLAPEMLARINLASKSES